MKVIYMFVGSLLYLCAVVLFAFALIASLKTNGLFLSEMFPTWLASALIALALALALAGLGIPWLGAQLKTGQGRPAAAPRA
jgi:ABC-type transport system involved in multi-copper enzyme maturation permease subunit